MARIHIETDNTVWLDTDEGAFDGLAIGDGSGDGVRASLLDAKDELQKAIKEIDQLLETFPSDG